MSNIHLFVIPGNPGIIEYYQDFVKNFHNIKINVIKYKNFSEDSEEFFLVDELQFVKNQIFDLIDYNDKNIIIGHSIGGWISLKLMEEINFDYCVLITPFLRKDFLSYKQVMFKSILRKKDMINDFYKFIKKNFIGKILFERIINDFDMSDNAKEITKKYFIKNDDILYKCLTLANSEFETLNYLFDLSLMNKFKDRLKFYYCENDIWAPKIDFYILKLLKFNVKLINIKHDFCVRKNDINLILSEINNDYLLF